MMMGAISFLERLVIICILILTLGALLPIPVGAYTHISLVPHIYYKRDVNDLEPFCGRGELIQPIDEVCRVCGKCRN